MNALGNARLWWLRLACVRLRAFSAGLMAVIGREQVG